MPLAPGETGPVPLYGGEALRREPQGERRPMTDADPMPAARRIADDGRPQADAAPPAPPAAAPGEVGEQTALLDVIAPAPPAPEPPPSPSAEHGGLLPIWLLAILGG